MKLPTREALFTEFQELHRASGVERIGLEILLNKYVRLAEEEARREAAAVIEKALADRTFHICPSCDFTDEESAALYAWRYKLIALANVIRGSPSAAPATADAGKATGINIGECVVTNTGPYPSASMRVQKKDTGPWEDVPGILRVPDAPTAPPPSKAVTEEQVKSVQRRMNELEYRLARVRYENQGMRTRIEDLESAARTALHSNASPPLPGTLYADSFRSAAGGKTDIEQAEVRGAVAMAKSIARTLREHGQRDAAKKIEEVLAPAAREGSGA